MRNKPDNRSDNVEKIQKHIDETLHNMEMAEEMIADTDNETIKRELSEKNEKREQALDGMRREIQDEAKYRQNNRKKEGK